LGQFGLTLNEAKTRILEFGRYAIERRARRGQRRPETFDFLGFTHICGQRRKTRTFIVRRVTAAKRMTATLKAIRASLMRQRHAPIPSIGAWLNASSTATMTDSISLSFNLPSVTITGWVPGLGRPTETIG
jgi:hypothetical protein